MWWHNNAIIKSHHFKWPETSPLYAGSFLPSIFSSICCHFFYKSTPDEQWKAVTVLRVLSAHELKKKPNKPKPCSSPNIQYCKVFLQLNCDAFYASLSCKGISLPPTGKCWDNWEATISPLFSTAFSLVLLIWSISHDF